VRHAHFLAKEKDNPQSNHDFISFVAVCEILRVAGSGIIFAIIFLVIF